MGLASSHCCSQDSFIEDSSSAGDRQLASAVEQVEDAPLHTPPDSCIQATDVSSHLQQPRTSSDLGSGEPASTALADAAPDVLTAEAATGNGPGRQLLTETVLSGVPQKEVLDAISEPAPEASLVVAPEPEMPAVTTQAAAGREVKAQQKTKAKPKAKPKPEPKPKPQATEAQVKDVAGMLDAALATGFKQLLPNKLVWAPGTEQLGELPGHVTLFQLSDTKADPFFNGGTFGITHYAPSSYGAAIGPPSLCQFMRFCQLLEGKLAAKDGDCIVLGTPKGDADARKNAAVLIGGYLILQHSWTVTSVVQLLADEARNTFPCPWYKACPEANNMTVKDCWAGLNMAVTQGWISKSDVMSETSCKAYMVLAETYDANWLAPGHVIVSADPMSTVMDPNPKTVQALGPTPKGWVGLKSEAVVGDFNFLCWSKNANIGLVVRANFSLEPGLKEIGGSYDQKAFTSRGISQLDAAVDDVKGGVPDARSISKVLERCASCTQERRCAVLLHCKAGFGRSVIYAACWLIQKFDVPGSSLLGWIRMCRPGSITTPDQEQFLQKLSGRKDVEKLLPSTKSGSRMLGKFFK